ncbi:unnamed protein product [Diamesa serratosioi]
MSSACPNAAKSLFSDSKRRLSDRVNVNVENCSSIARAVIRGSKSHDILMQSAKNLAQQENALENSSSNLNKISLIQKQLGYQYEAIREGAEKLSDIGEQTSAMER